MIEKWLGSYLFDNVFPQTPLHNYKYNHLLRQYTPRRYDMDRLHTHLSLKTNDYNYA